MPSAVSSGPAVPNELDPSGGGSFRNSRAERFGYARVSQSGVTLFKVWVNGPRG